MATSLKHQFLINEVVWRLTPRYFMLLVKQFHSMATKAIRFKETEETQTLEQTDSFYGLSEEIKGAYKKLLHDFNHDVLALRLGDAQSEQVMIHAHILGSACSDSIRNQLENILPDFKSDIALEDFIIDVYLNYGLDDIQQAMRISMAREVQSYNYFVPGSNFLFIHKDKQPQEPTEEKIKALKAYLADYFNKYFKSKLCEIYKGVFNTKYYLTITHAGPNKQERRAKDNKADNFAFQPVEFDTIVFDLKTRDLCIHVEADRKRDIDEYVKVAGDIFFEEKEFWSTQEKYTLAPLQLARKKHLRDMLDVEQASRFITVPNGKLSGIRLTEIFYFRQTDNGSESTRHAKNTVCLYKELKEDEELLVPEGYFLRNACFNFDYIGAMCGHQSAKMYLSAAKKRLPKGEAGIDGEEAWLENFGFLKRATYQAEILPDWFNKLSEESQARFSPRIRRAKDAFDDDENPFRLENENEPS